MSGFVHAEPAKAVQKKAAESAASSPRVQLKNALATGGYEAGRAAVSPTVQLKPARDLQDPEVVTNKDTKQKDPYAYRKNDRDATLYGANGVQVNDVRQGAITDCYLPAAMAAVVNANPETIKNAITDNGDSTFTVRFYQVDWQGKKTEVKIDVDSDLPYNGDAPAYGKSTEAKELWPSILEKAYAQWKGSYDEIGHGGVSGDVMEALTGNRSRQMNMSSGDALWTKMKQATEQRKPMTAGTGDKDDAKYKDPKAGVYGWHAYTVLGVEEKKEGDKTVRSVKIRNPWAQRRRAADATAVGDAENATASGVFTLSWEEFQRLYDDVSING